MSQDEDRMGAPAPIVDERPRPAWHAPRLVPLAATGGAGNSLSGMGDIDATYSGFPYGYS